MMQFKLHINDTSDGDQIAEDLRRMADMVEGHILTNGFRRSTLRPGYAIMEIKEPEPEASHGSSGTLC